MRSRAFFLSWLSARGYTALVLLGEWFFVEESFQLKYIWEV